MPGPAPKPAHLRQRTNKKAGATVLTMPEQPGAVRDIPNPDGRAWHPLTLVQWANAWASPMADQWLETDYDGLGRLALLWDLVNRDPGADALDAMKEIRLQEARFGLTPLDRSRLQWEVARGEEADRRRPAEPPKVRRSSTDPRKVLMMASKA